MEDKRTLTLTSSKKQDHPLIALAVIAGESAIEDGIERMLKSVIGQVDGVYIAYTGSSDGTTDGNVEVFDKICSILDPEDFDYGCIAPIGWHNDFSEARNRSFELATTQTGLKYDWILWLDCDDVIPDDVDLRLAAETLADRKAHGGFMQYEYEYDQERDMPLVTHFKERIFRADIEWLWENPIHENCHGPFGTRMTKLPEAQRVRHLRGEVKPKRDRNRAIVGRWFQEHPDNPRALLYYAHETYAMAEETRGLLETMPGAREQISAAADVLYKQSLKLYQQYIATQPESDDTYTCNRQCADILRILGRFDDAINVDLQGIKMQPENVASYVGIAESYLQSQDYELAVQWAIKALGVRRPTAAMKVGLGPVIGLEQDYKPLMIASMAHKALGNLTAALHFGRRAVVIRDDLWTKHNIEEIKSLQEIHPDPPAGTSIMIDINRKRYWGTSPDNSIAFFVPPSAEVWNPNTLKHGMGGTETTIVKVARELAAGGMRVAIFGTPGDWDGCHQKIGEGQVEWYSSGSWHPDEPFTYFVGLRAPQIMDAPIKAQVKILWVHDLSVGPTRYGERGDRFSNCDAIIYPSFSHSLHFKRIYKFVSDPWTAETQILENGFDTEPFNYRQESLRFERDRFKVVYASSPDRGLSRLLELWPQIQQRVPDASLDVFYGWDSIDAIIAHGGPTAEQLAYFKQNTQETMRSLGEAGYKVRWRGRVGEEQLGNIFKRSGVMAYPANFQETFGIVFAQAMSAGVIPVVSNLGHLPWMVKTNGIVVPGSPDSREFGARFVDAMQMALTDVKPGVRCQLSESVDYLDYSTHAQFWLHTLKNIKAAKEARA